MRAWIDEIISISRNRIDLIGVAVFSVVVGIVRLPYLGYLSFWGDEAAHVLAGNGILKYGYPILPSGVLYRHGPLYSYFSAVSFMVLGTSEFSARIVSLIFSSLTLPLVYLLGKELGNKPVGAIGTLIVALSPWTAGWARQARMYAQFQFFFLLTIYLFFKNFVKENQSRHLLGYNSLLIFSFLCALLSHELAITLIPSFFVYLLLMKGVSWIRNRYAIIAIIVVGFSFLLFFFVVIGLPRALDLIVNVLKLYRLRSNAVFSYATFFERYPVLSFSFVMGASMLLMGKDRNLFFLYFNFLVPLHLIVIAVTITGVMYERYLFVLLPIYVLASSFALLQHVRHISETIAWKSARAREIIYRLNRDDVRKMTTRIILAIIVFLVILNLDVRVFHPGLYPSLPEAFSYYQQEHRSPTIDIQYGDFRGASEFVKQQYQEGDVIVSTQLASVYYYLQTMILEENITLFYLRQRGWIETHVNSIMINNLDGLRDVLYTSRRTWIIADHHFMGKYISPEVRDFVVENTELVYENDENFIQVYLWS